MAARYLLYLTTHQLTAYTWAGGVLTEDASFESDDAATSLVDYLQQRQSALVTLVINVAEEGFQSDTIPFLQSRDRQAVIGRRIGQLYPTAPLTVTISQGFEKTRRRDERVLFAALTNGPSIEPWLQALTTAESRIVGVYSLPLLAESLAERLQLPRERCLLVTVQDNSIRQTFFNRSRMQFSRLSPLNNSSISGIAQSIAIDAAKTQQYLLSQRLIARADPLSVHVLAHPQAVQAVTAACVGTDTLRFSVHDHHLSSRKLGLRTLPADSGAELLYLHLAAANPPRLQFERPALRKAYRLWQAKTLLYALGAATFAGCVLVSAKDVFELIDLRARSELAQTTASMADQRYQSIVQTFPALPVNHDALRQVIAKYSELKRLSPSPAAMMVDLSQVLSASPQIEIDQIVWSGSKPAAAAPAADKPAPPPTPGDKPSDATDAASETATVKGHVMVRGNASPREVLAIFDAFVKGLRSDPDLSVTVQNQPYDVGAEKSLKSGDQASSNAPGPFSLTLARRPST